MATQVSSSAATSSAQKLSVDIVEPSIVTIADSTGVTEGQSAKSLKPAPAKSIVSEIPKKKAVVLEAKQVKEADPVEEAIQQLSELPDPLVTGKIDESELLKIVPLEVDTVLDQNRIQGQDKKSPTKTMVTRFRNRPKNMSVIEAAAQKKAKSNDTSSIYALKSPTKSKVKATKQTSANKTVKSPKNSEKSKAEKSVVVKNSDVHTEKLKPEIDKQKVTSNQSSINEYVSKPTDTTPSVNPQPKDKHTVIKTRELALKSVEKVTLSNVTSDKSNVLVDPEPPTTKAVEEKDAAVSLKRKAADKEKTSGETGTGIVLENDLAEDVPITASPPKKAKNRKAILEQQNESPKDTVYMRPPPKKRTKEIREMMKHEEDVTEEVKQPTESQKLHLPPEPTQKQTENTLEKDIKNIGIEEKKINVKKGKKKIVKDSVMMQQVFDIELTGKGIEGDKHYRCSLCNNVFIFARRVVNHLVNTHDISLEESKEYVLVEPKSACPKICDVCGYRPKEVNIYYIHFHKYFRHGVPLPKGWQPFTCDLCKKEFFTKFQLREHKLIHFEDNPFVCEVCGSGFKSRTCLNSHVFHKHSSVRKYVCSECPKTFKTRTQLKVHSRVHSGDKPFACPDVQCTYRSTTRGNMRLHLVNRHKFPNDYIKNVMNTLQPSEAAPVQQEPEIQEANWTEQEHDVVERDINEERAVEMASDPATLTTLVEAAVAEVNNASGYPVQVLHEPSDGSDPSINPVLHGVDNMASQLMEHDQAEAQTGRDYTDMSLVHPVQLVQNMYMASDAQGQGSMGAGQMLVAADMELQESPELLLRHPDPGTNPAVLHSYPQQTQGQTSGQHTVTIVPLQEYRDTDQSVSSQSYSDMKLPVVDAEHYTQDQRLDVQHHRLRIDPGSREARMIVKEVLQGHEPRSLKAAMKLLVERTSLDTRALISAHGLHGEHQFPEDSPLVIDTHAEPPLVIDEEHVVHNVRLEEQFRGAHSHSTAMFRGGHDSAQHQDLDQTHMQSFQQTSSMAPPPSYSGSSHGMITAIPVSNMATSHDLDQGQFQSEALQAIPLPQQTAGYGETSSQPQTSQQMSSDASSYGSYYQQHFPIENY